jgi:hypothetical protein
LEHQYQASYKKNKSPAYDHDYHHDTLSTLDHCDTHINKALVVSKNDLYEIIE